MTVFEFCHFWRKSDSLSKSMRIRVFPSAAWKEKKIVLFKINLLRCMLLVSNQALNLSSTRALIKERGKETWKNALPFMKGLHVFSFQVNGIMGPCIFHPSIFHPENNSLPSFSMNNALFLKLKRHSFDFPLCLAFWVIFKQGNSRTWNECFINIFTWSSNSSLAIISWFLKYFFFLPKQSLRYCIY